MDVCAQIYVASNGLGIPSVVVGHGITVVWGKDATGSVAPTSTMTVYWPERYAMNKITQLYADYHSATTSQVTGFINGAVVYTVPSTGPSYSIFQFVIPTTGTQTFVPSQGSVFLMLEAELGM